MSKKLNSTLHLTNSTNKSVLTSFTWKCQQFKVKKHLKISRAPSQDLLFKWEVAQQEALDCVEITRKRKSGSNSLILASCLLARWKGEIHTKDKSASGKLSQEDEASVSISILMGSFKNQLECSFSAAVWHAGRRWVPQPNINIYGLDVSHIPSPSEILMIIITIDEPLTSMFLGFSS